MMERKFVPVVVALAVSMILSACSKIENGKVGINPNVNLPGTGATDAIKNNTNSPLPRGQTPKPANISGNINDKENDLKSVITELNESLRGVNNKNLSRDERLKLLTSFLEDIKSLLAKRESTKYSDEELQKALDYNIFVSKTIIANINGVDTSLRIVRYDGLPELCGTLERKWTYVQWWDDKRVNTQIIVNKGADVIDDFLMVKVKDKPTLVLAGYYTVYKPFPVILSTWQMSDDKWNKVGVFNSTIISNNLWDFKLSENKLTVENKNKDEITVETNQQRDGFLIYSETDQNKRIELKLLGDQISIIK